MSFDDREGLLTLKGQSVQLHRHLDALFREWAEIVNAIEYSFPPVLSVYSLDLADYFSSFPHLATLTTRIDPQSDSLAQLTKTDAQQSLTKIDQIHLSPSQYVLPSAACYSVYNHFRGQQLDKDQFITVVSPCFRYEESYSASQRQWSFHMREIVCLGQEKTVQKFLAQYNQHLLNVLEEAGLPVQIEQATDPFFDKRDPRKLIQKLEPVKKEILYQGKLAISSLNFHRNFFGERFKILDVLGEPISSGCVAFGLERWLYACIQEYGPDLNQWPQVLKI